MLCDLAGPPERKSDVSPPVSVRGSMPTDLSSGDEMPTRCHGTFERSSERVFERAISPDHTTCRLSSTRSRGNLQQTALPSQIRLFLFYLLLVRDGGLLAFFSFFFITHRYHQSSTTPISPNTSARLTPRLPHRFRCWLPSLPRLIISRNLCRTSIPRRLRVPCSQRRFRLLKIRYAPDVT